MNLDPGRAALRRLMRNSGVSFFALRVLQRWSRGEITTDAAVELLQPEDAARLVGTWTSSRM